MATLNPFSADTSHQAVEYVSIGNAMFGGAAHVDLGGRTLRYAAGGGAEWAEVRHHSISESQLQQEKLDAAERANDAALTQLKRAGLVFFDTMGSTAQPGTIYRFPGKAADGGDVRCSSASSALSLAITFIAEDAQRATLAEAAREANARRRAEMDATRATREAVRAEAKARGVEVAFYGDQTTVTEGRPGDRLRHCTYPSSEWALRDLREDKFRPIPGRRHLASR